MLSNLILDIGNVICDWNPHGLVSTVFSEPDDRAEALSVTIETSDWLELDKGTLALEMAISRAQARTQLDPDAIAQIYVNLCNSLVELPESAKAMQRARAAGVPMYVLSNMQAHAWSHLKRTYSCFDICSGVVVSCETGFIKPDKAIYQHLCDKFSLTPASCVFVDDMAENIEAARAFGMQGVQLTDKFAGGEVIDELVAKIVGQRS